MIIDLQLHEPDVGVDSLDRGCRKVDSVRKGVPDSRMKSLWESMIDEDLKVQVIRPIV